MPRMTVKLNRAGVRELLRSDELAGYLEGIAKEKASQMSDGYGTDVYYGKNRVNVSICTKSDKAYQDNLDNNTLLKGVGA